jgi:hypothetical protein
MNENTNRRDFFKGSAAAAALGFSILKPQSVRGAQANSALTVGLIGCGRRGTAISGIFAKNEFARIAYICDIYDDQIAAASKIFSGAKPFKNIDDMLASDVDAVYIATPPFLHPEHFEKAVSAASLPPPRRPTQPSESRSITSSVTASITRKPTRL